MGQDIGAWVFRGVSQTLKNVILQHISELNESSVLFESPGDIEVNGETRLLVYLYQVNDNPYLKNIPPRIERVTDKESKLTKILEYPPPLAVDLVYMLVPYAKKTEVELVLVDKLKRLFYEFALLEGDVVDSVLTNTGNPSIRLVPDNLSIDTLRQVWMGFPNKSHKLTLFYTVSPILVPSSKPPKVYQQPAKVVYKVEPIEKNAYKRR